MSLQNLLGVSLENVTPEKETVRRLLAAAVRHIADAKVRSISAETRFSSAYTAIRMLADVGLHAQGVPHVDEQTWAPSNRDPSVDEKSECRFEDRDTSGQASEATEPDGVLWRYHS